MRRGVFFLFAFLLLSCSIQKQIPALSTAELAAYLWSYKDAHPQGFTLSLTTLSEPSWGISVAFESTLTGKNPEELEKIVSHSLAHEGYVGGWQDSRDSTYCFDSVRLFPENQRKKALRFARKNHQAAFYVISTSEEVWVAPKD
jgi:hypothetical protein